MGIADAIDAVTARALAGSVAPVRSEWASAAIRGDSIVRGHLIDSLADTRGNSYTLERIELLVPHLPDPRVSKKLADLVERPIYNASVSRTTAFWRRLFELLPAIGDPRIADRSATWEATWAANAELTAAERDALGRRLAAIRASLATAYGRALAVVDTSAILAALAPLAQGPSLEAALLAAVYAAPDDDQPRLVYSDWLLERGDPRGELIALQLSTQREPARERAMIAAHRKALLGSLAAKVKVGGLRFERGFVSVCTPKQDIDDDPAWATVRELSGAVPASDACRMPVLRTVREIGASELAQLAAVTKPLAIDDIDYQETSGFHVAGAGASALRAIRSIALRRFAVDGFIPTAMQLEHYAWIWNAPCCASLEVVELVSMLSQLPMWLDAIEPTAIARVVVWGSMGPCDYYGTNSRYSWAIEATRDGHGALSRLALIAPRGAPDRRPDGTYATEPLAALAALAGDRITTLRVKVPAARRGLYELHVRPRLEALISHHPRVRSIEVA